MAERRFVTVASLRLRILDTGPPVAGTPQRGADGGAANGAVGGDDGGAVNAREALPLLVIPGHTARIEGFDEMLPDLAARRRVVVVDLPGSGESEKPDRRYDLRFFEDVLVAVLDELGIAQAVPVGGSLGGNLVLRLGHRFPDRFPELVLWAPGGAWRAHPRLGRFVMGLGRWAFWPSVRIQSRYWYEPGFAGREQALTDTFDYYRRVMCPGFVRMYWGIAGDQIAHSLFDIAPSISQRTLLMWGDRDHGAGMGDGVAELHRLLPDSRLVIFPGARHSLETEIPGELAATVNRFLDRA